VVSLVLYALAREPLRVHQGLGFTRQEDLVQSLSARASDFLSRPLRAIAPFPSREDPSAFTQGLFPGLLLLALAALGAIAPLPDSRRGRWRWYALVACQVAFLLTLGLNLSFAGWRPFATLRKLPGFAEIRSVFRCAVFVQVHLVLLAAFGLAAIQRRFGPTLRAKASVLGIGLLAAVENLGTPVALLPLPRSAAWVAYLASQPPGTVVAHIPFPRSGTVEDLEPEAYRMLAQITHRQPLVNGYASNFPAVHREFLFAMSAAFPNHPLGCALRRVFETDLLVVDQGWLSSHRPGFAQFATMLVPVYSDSDVAVFRMEPSLDECPPMRLQVGHP
jgi:hypothetical protein